MVVDGLMQASDLTAEGEQSYFAKIRPMNPHETDWVTGFVQEKFLTLVSLYPRTVVNHVQERSSAEFIPFPRSGTSRNKIAPLGYTPATTRRARNPLNGGSSQGL